MSGSVGIVKTSFAEFDVELPVESGRMLGPLTLAFETYGTLNAARSNTVWVAHATLSPAETRRTSGFHTSFTP